MVPRVENCGRFHPLFPLPSTEGDSKPSPLAGERRVRGCASTLRTPRISRGVTRTDAGAHDMDVRRPQRIRSGRLDAALRTATTKHERQHPT